MGLSIKNNGSDELKSENTDQELVKEFNATKN